MDNGDCMENNQFNISTYVNNIGTLIKSHDSSVKVTYKKKSRINFTEQNNYVFYLDSGSVSLYKKNDNLFLMKFSAPQIVGLFKIWVPNKYFYIRCDEVCTFWIINHKILSEQISSKNLWQESFNIICDKVKRLFEYDQKATFNCTRDIVVAHLKDIWLLPQQERNNTSIYKYIMMRNHISRSAIYKIISELQGQKLILIQRGTLCFFKESYFNNISHSGINSY